MPVIYRGFKIIPAPPISIQKTYQRAGDGRKVGTLFNLSIKGTIVPYKGSPIVAVGTSNDVEFDTGGTFDYPADATLTLNDRQNAIRVKQEALRELFSVDGELFEITPWNGQPGMICHPRVKDINFPEGLWVERCDYTIELETDRLICGIPGLAPYEDADASGDPVSADKYTGMDIPKDYYVQSVSETWGIDFDTEIYGLFKVNHSVSAVGKRTWDDAVSPIAVNREAWENAKDWVEDRLGYNPLYAMSGSINIPSGVYSAYNHIRTQNVNYFNGEYAINETWVLSTGNFYETFSIETRRSQQDGLTQVSLQGIVTGLDTNIVGAGAMPLASDKYTNASGAWVSTVKPNLFTRAQFYTGLSLNVTALTEVIGRNPNTGVINYNYEYNNRPSNCLGTGVLSESISVTDDNAEGDITQIAEILVLNRAEGPVLQSLGTTRAKKRQVNIEAVVELTGITCIANLTAPSTLKTNAAAIIASLTPGGTGYVTNSSETWSPTSGRYNRVYEWTYE
jgi:hypothetical protein